MAFNAALALLKSKQRERKGSERNFVHNAKRYLYASTQTHQSGMSAVCTILLPTSQIKKYYIQPVTNNKAK